MTVKKKKVLFTSHTANFQKFNRPFMRWFREQGWEVHYASMGEEQILDCDQAFTVPFTRSPFKFIGNFRAYRQLRRIIDSENYDIIHTHTPMGSVVTRLAARAARKRGTRVIYTAHGFHFFTGAPLINWLIYYPVERYMARHTDTLITINTEDYKRAKSQFSTQVKYTPGVGVDMTRFKSLTNKQWQEMRLKYAFTTDDFIIINVAELNSNKNQMYLISCMPKLLKEKPSAKLLLCGDGNLKDTYKKLINKLGLENAVLIMGYRNDILELFQISDICVASSKREGLAINLIEALSVGIPVVASNNRGHRDIANSCSNIHIFNLNDTDTFVALATNVSRDQHSKTTVQKSLLVFDTTRVLEQTSQIYMELPE